MSQREPGGPVTTHEISFTDPIIQALLHPRAHCRPTLGSPDSGRLYKILHIWRSAVARCDGFVKGDGKKDPDPGSQAVAAEPPEPQQPPWTHPGTQEVDGPEEPTLLDDRLYPK